MFRPCGLSHSVIVSLPLKVSIETLPSDPNGNVFLISLTVWPRLRLAAPAHRISKALRIMDFLVVISSSYGQYCIYSPPGMCRSLHEGFSSGRKLRGPGFKIVTP